MAKAGASQYTFHIEATNNITDCIQRVKAANMKVGWHQHIVVFSSVILRSVPYVHMCICTHVQIVLYNVEHDFSNLFIRND